MEAMFMQYTNRDKKHNMKKLHCGSTKHKIYICTKTCIQMNLVVCCVCITKAFTSITFFYEHMSSLITFPWELKGKFVKVFYFCFLANLSIHLELMCNNEVRLVSWCESHHATQNFEVQAFQMGFKGLKTFCILNQKLMVLVGNDWKDEKVFDDCCVDDLTL